MRKLDPRASCWVHKSHLRRSDAAWPGPVVWEVLVVLKRNAKEQLGLDFKGIKAEYHATTGAAGGVPPSAARPLMGMPR